MVVTHEKQLTNDEQFAEDELDPNADFESEMEANAALIEEEAARPEQELLVWTAPSRPYKKRSKDFYTTVGALVILLSIILFFAKEFLLVGAILALGFFAYALAAVEPEIVEHKLTTRGVRTFGKLYPWKVMGRFWWEERWKQEFVAIELLQQFPNQLQLLVGDGDREQIDIIFDKYLVKERPLPTFVDKAASWLQEKVPSESE